MSTVIQIPSTHVSAKWAWKPAWIPSSIRNGDRDSPKASRVAGLCKMMNSGFNKRCCLDIQGWRVFEGDIWHQLWSSTYVHPYTYIHSQMSIHITHTYKKETEMQWWIYRGIAWLYVTMNIWKHELWVVFFNDKGWQFKNASGSYILHIAHIIL